MAETVYTGALESEQQGDIVLDPRTRLGNVGTLDTTKVEVREGGDYVTATVSEDKLKVNVKATGVTDEDGVVTAQVVVIADKNKDPNAEDNEVGIFNLTITAAGVVAVPMIFSNVRPVDEA